MSAYVCASDGCPNAGVPMPVDTTPGSRVVCGGCQGTGVAVEQPDTPKRRKGSA